MSTYYDIYLEGLVNSKWTALGPWFKMPDNSFRIVPILTGCSSVREMLDNIDYSWGALEDVSDEVLQKIVYKDYDGNEQKNDCYWFDSGALSRIDPAHFEYEGYAPRHQVAMFERGDSDVICDWLDPMEYAAMSSFEKQAYTYYRWTEPGGPYALRVELKQRAAAVCSMYEECWWEGRPSKPTDTRFIVVIS